LVDEKAWYDAPEIPSQLRLKLPPLTLEFRSGAIEVTIRKFWAVIGPETLAKERKLGTNAEVPRAGVRVPFQP
jgi:hypothetical protein